MASANGLWTPITDKEIKAGRKNLPKGHTREQNTAHTVGLDTVEADGDQVTLEQTPMPQSMAQAAIPREVAQEIYGLIWSWASQSRENFQLMAKIVRNSYPDAYGHLTDEELASKIEQHAKDAARKATEDVYEEKWDNGNDLDMWQGKPITP